MPMTETSYPAPLLCDVRYGVDTLPPHLLLPRLTAQLSNPLIHADHSVEDVD